MMETKKQSIIEEEQGNENLPKTTKGIRMKNNIMLSAKSVFSELGYFNTRIVDITEKAGISEGNFYRYYKNKDEVLSVLLTNLITEIYEASRTKDIEGSFYDKMIISTKRLFKVYKQNSGLYKVLLQIVHYDVKFYDLWMDMRSSFIKRIRKELVNVDLPEHIDKDYAASALGGMISQFAYIWCVLEGDIEKEFDVDKAAETVTSLWYRSIYLEGKEQ